jgi:hypothetical protein
MTGKFTAADAEADRRLEQLSRELGDEAIKKASERRWQRKRKRRGRPPEDFLYAPVVTEMVRIMKQAGYDFWDQRAVSKVANEVSKTVAEKRTFNYKKRPDAVRANISKTLIKKFKATIAEANEDIRLEIRLSLVTLCLEIKLLRYYWAPYGHLPEGAAALAQLDDFESAILTVCPAWSVPERPPFLEPLPQFDERLTQLLAADDELRQALATGDGDGGDERSASKRKGADTRPRR